MKVSQHNSGGLAVKEPQRDCEVTCRGATPLPSQRNIAVCFVHFHFAFSKTGVEGDSNVQSGVDKAPTPLIKEPYQIHFKQLCNFFMMVSAGGGRRGGSSISKTTAGTINKGEIDLTRTTTPPATSCPAPGGIAWRSSRDLDGVMLLQVHLWHVRKAGRYYSGTEWTSRCTREAARRTARCGATCSRKRICIDDRKRRLLPFFCLFLSCLCWRSLLVPFGSIQFSLLAWTFFRPF
jgi:hypothetical protein